MLEATLERRFRLAVRKLGGIAEKLTPTRKGMPDRLVLLPGRPAELVELKRPGGAVSPAQRVWHDKAAAIGHPVTVLASLEDLEAWVGAKGSP